MDTALDDAPRPGPQPHSSDALTPLRTPAFQRYALANLISATGTAMAPLALAYAVLGIGGGPGSLAAVLVTNTLPTIAFVLAGGVLADRFSRSRILFLGNLLAGAAQAAVAVLVAGQYATTVSIAVCGFVSGVATAFIVPAAQGIVAEVVAPQHLQQANALVRLPRNAVKVLGPVVGGVVVAAAGPAWALGWDALTFCAAALLLLGLRLKAPVPQPASAPAHTPVPQQASASPAEVVAAEASAASASVAEAPQPAPAPALAPTQAARPTLLADLRTGWTAFRSRTWLWTYTASGTVVVAAWLAGYQLLGPIVAAQRYDGARTWGLVQGAFALGLFAGSVLALRWRPYRLLAVALTGGVGLALPPAVLGLGLPLAWVLPAALLAGIVLDVAIVAWNTVLQQHVPKNEIGRMSSFNDVGERLAIPLGYLVAALAAHAWDNRSVLLFCAAAIAVATAANLCVPDVYRINRIGAEGTGR